MDEKCVVIYIFFFFTFFFPFTITYMQIILDITPQCYIYPPLRLMTCDKLTKVVEQPTNDLV